MAPVTRRGQIAAKKPPPRRNRPVTRASQNTDTWALAGNDEDSQEDDSDSADDPEAEAKAAEVASRLIGFGSPVSLPRASPVPKPPDTALTQHPLREMAEKVGREVETFAEKLDAFFDATADRPDRFQAVIELVHEYKAIADDAVTALTESNKFERAQILRKEWTDRELASNASTLSAPPSLFASTTKSNPDFSTSLVQTKKTEQVQLSRQWQQEADLWDLFRVILEVHHDPDAESTRTEHMARLDREGPPDRYKSEEDLYERFLISDDQARERAIIKGWLERTAEHQESDIEGITKELEIKAKRGTGLWSSGCMYTREKIKGEKRLRNWPAADEYPLPQLKRSDNPELLVTTLDPDAPSRQARTLEKPDAYFERAVWVACWEMLRRGKPWTEVARWYDEHREGWRAVSIGKSSDREDTRSNALWRRMCYLASQSSSGSSGYETAVYGLLGGNLSAIKKICRTVDDHIYAHYSVALTRQFDQYLAAHFPDRAAPHPLPLDDELQDPKLAVYQLVAGMRAYPATSREAVQPMKVIQSYLLANDVPNMIHTLGCAIAYTDTLRSDSEGIIAHLRAFWTEADVKSESEIALNPQTLRIATHMGLLLRALGDGPISDEDSEAEANVLVAYIQTLRAAGKRDLIPLYASKLPSERSIKVLSRTLLDITDPGEQESILALMSQNQSNCVAILQEQLNFLLQSKSDLDVAHRVPFKMLEDTPDTKLYPGQRIIEGFAPEQFSEQDESIVRSLRWFSILPGHWNETFQALSLALRKCLISGRIVCALRVLKEFPYDTVSVRKSYQVIGKSINLMEYDGRSPAEEAALWNNLKRQSRTYYELEALLSAIRALTVWRDEEAAYTTKKPKLSSAPVEVKRAKELVKDALAPVLGGILNDPLDESEAADLAEIRVSYIPEIVLAYNTVLHSAGSIITRDALIESMDLSVVIASEQINGRPNQIAECFVRAKRMRELVASFALTSKAMLLLKAEGKPWRPRKDREGKDLGLWEIGPQMLDVREASVEPDGHLKRQPFSRRSSNATPLLANDDRDGDVIVVKSELPRTGLPKVLKPRICKSREAVRGR